MQTQAYRWIDLDTLDSEQRKAALAEVRTLIGRTADHRLERDPAWLESETIEGRRLRVFVRRDAAGNVAGYAPFLEHPSALSFQVFGMDVLYFRVRRQTLAGDPLLMEDGDAWGRAIEDLFLEAMEMAGSGTVLFAGGVARGSRFEQLLLASRRIRQRAFVFPFGPYFRHWRILFPTTFDQYLRQLSQNKRKDIKRNERRLAESVPGGYRVAVFTDEAQVDEFLRLAEMVSRRTYQWNRLEMGITNDEGTRRRYRAAAAQGMFRGYLLFCGEEPAAFRVGFVANGFFFAMLTGYDPKWARLGVGNVINTASMRDLIESGFRGLDFMYGDSEMKRRLGNHCTEERHYYVVPKSLRFYLIVPPLRAYNWLVERLRTVVERSGMVSRLRAVFVKGAPGAREEAETA